MLLGDLNESESSSSEELDETELTNNEKQTLIKDLVAESKPGMTLRQKKVAALMEKFKQGVDSSDGSDCNDSSVYDA